MNKSRRGWLGMMAAAVVIGLAGAATYMLWFRHGLPADVRAALDSSSSWTLVSLEPDITGDKGEAEVLHGYKVLGRLPLSNPAKALDEVREIDRHYNISGGAKCFFPRHALEGRMNDGRKLELLICYECERLCWYIDGGKSPGEMTFSKIESTVLSDLLKEGGVPLPPPPK